MTRLCRDSSRSYSGRSVQPQPGLRAVPKGTGNPPNPKVLSGHQGSRTEGHLERDGEPTESYSDPECPSGGNVRGDGQKSAEAIVAGVSAKGRTVSNKEEP